MRYYLNPYAQSLANYAYFTEFNLGVILFAEAVSELPIISSNLLFLLVTMTVLSNLSIDSYL
jgi:hypothetical protein